MNFITLVLNRFGRYSYHDGSNLGIYILSNFLSRDVGCYSSTFKKWALADKTDPNYRVSWGISGNTSYAEEDKDDGFIYLGSNLPLEEGEKQIEFQLTKKQFVKILDDWEQKVCKSKPKEVTIKHIGDEFIFETKD